MSHYLAGGAGSLADMFCGFIFVYIVVKAIFGGPSRKHVHKRVQWWNAGRW